MSPSPPSSPSSANDYAAAPPSTAASPSAVAADPSTALITTIASPSPIAALPAPNANPNSSGRRLPPPCWTNEETLALIDSYREKWYSLRRGNLRAAHWDEVAASVAQRCSHLPTATPKTSVQCRHKIEKLRKRYRSERQRSLSHDPTAVPCSSWIFFNNMNQMENPNPNPTPKPNHRPHHRRRHHQDHESDYDDDDENEEIDEPFYQRRPHAVANGGSGGGGGLKIKIPKAVRSSRAIPVGIPSSNVNPNPSYGSFSKGFVKPGLEDMRRRLEAKRRREEDDQGESDSGAMGDMVRALRLLGDGYTRMEQMKIDMAREMERARMEMELKRTEMILDTQKRIVDSFVKGFLGEKKVKRSPDS